MTPFFLCILWALVCAEKEADEDFKLIATHKPVHHTISEWLERAQIVLLGGLVCVFIGLICNGLSYFSWPLLLWIPAGWASFTSGFRWFLNRKRGLDWRYISPSNGYDWQFIRIAWFNGFSRALSISEAKEYHEEFYVPSGRNDQYQPAVHRAGTIAYAFELSILTASTILYAWTPTH